MKLIIYASAVGSLMYAMVCIRLDIAHTIGLVSRFMSNLGKQHWCTMKWIIWYLKGIVDEELLFDMGSSL